jgi:FkbM family methyltransferase
MAGELLLKYFDFGLVRELYGLNIYFPDISFIPTPRSKVIDLGSNVGLMSLLCAKYGAYVLAVEAQSGFVNCARENIALNQLDHRIELVHAIVGSGSGAFSNKENRIAATHWHDEPAEVSMADLLRHFLRSKEESVHLLKIDIEGSEFDLFSKNIDWLDSVRHISMEVHPEFGNVLSLRRRIENAGFKCALRSSWRESGVPNRYPAFLFASKGLESC